MKWYVIIPSEVTQRYIQHHIRNDWNYSQVVERFVLVRTIQLLVKGSQVKRGYRNTVALNH
jgi:hypothetical protein